MPRCEFFCSYPMMAFVVIPEILITTCCGLCGAFNMDVAVCMDAWSLSIFLMLPGASSLHVGGSTRGSGAGYLRLILNMLRHGFHSRANDGFWGELQNRGVGCFVMLDDGSWVNRETLTVRLELTDLGSFHPTTCRGLCGISNVDVAVCLKGWSLSIFLMLPGASSLHVGGSTRGHMMAFVPRKLPAHTRWLLRLYLELLRVGSVAWPPHFEHVRMLLFRWGGQATTLFVFSGAFNFEEVVFLG
ncbi:hypothetical protein VNO77_27025 [Canavalia gladiata]|uniref:Uncharacterized protein n=1 Tax=Canavalia gladiata TaxID=3824 RepID=A0AAN9KWG8_CANGL